MNSRAATFTGITVAAITTIAVLLAGLSAQPGPAAAQSGTALIIDARTQGNSPSGAGEPDFCVSADKGDEISVDVVITGAEDLLSWEATVVHDRSVLEIVEQDVRMFIASEPGSNPLDASEPLPDVNGRHLLAVGDVSSSTDSGSGVLARIRFKAVDEGISQVSIPQRDINSDGHADEGAQLTQKGGVPIGDTNGDRFFDGPVTPAFVAVGASCEDVTPAPPPVPTGAPGGATSQPTTSPGAVATASPEPSEDAPQGSVPTNGSEPSGTRSPGDGPGATGAAGVGGPGDGGTPGGSGDGGSGLPAWLIVAIGGIIIAAGGGAILAYRHANGGTE